MSGFFKNAKNQVSILKDLTEKLAVAEEASAACELRNYDKLQYSNSDARHAEVIKEAMRFVKVDRDFEIDFHHGVGVFMVGDKFIIAPRSRKWRVQGKGTWYRYKNPDQFIKKYLLREEVNV